MQTYSATDYYEEALSRDPDDVRNNNAMGLWLIRKGQFAKAEPYFTPCCQDADGKEPEPV